MGRFNLAQGPLPIYQLIIHNRLAPVTTESTTKATTFEEEPSVASGFNE